MSVVAPTFLGIVNRRVNARTPLSRTETATVARRGVTTRANETRPAAILHLAQFSAPTSAEHCVAEAEPRESAMRTWIRRAASLRTLTVPVGGFGGVTAGGTIVTGVAVTLPEGPGRIVPLPPEAPILRGSNVGSIVSGGLNAFAIDPHGTSLWF